MPELRSRTLRRVGHKGADRIAPGNTYASFDAALAAGVDMIEFDVLPDHLGDRLLLAHDPHEFESRTPHTLEEGLEHLASARFAAVELDVDLKLPGYELRVLEALRAHGLVERTLVSTQYRSSLRVLRAAEPALRLGWSVPKLRRDPFHSPYLLPLAIGAMYVGQAVLPGRAAQAIRNGFCDAMMVHWRLVTPRLVQSIHDAGGELYVWTVDELEQVQRFDALGVTGVITNDPRLFAALAG